MKKTLSQLLEGLLSKPHARLKFSEIRNELTRLSGQTISQKEVENAIAVLREKRRDLVYAKDLGLS